MRARRTLRQSEFALGCGFCRNRPSHLLNEMVAAATREEAIHSIVGDKNSSISPIILSHWSAASQALRASSAGRPVILAHQHWLEQLPARCWPKGLAQKMQVGRCISVGTQL
jgi:hypothetical protein